MTRDAGLFAAGRPVVGPREHAWERTLAAWRRTGHLVGDAGAAIRSTIRAAARNVDRAERDPDTSPYVIAMILRHYNELLMQHAPPAATDDADPWADV